MNHQIKQDEATIIKLQCKLEELNRINKTIKNLENDKIIYDKLMDILKEDNLLNYYLSKNILPAIEQKTNNILGLCTDFRISIICDRNKILINKIVGGITIKSAKFCGFENFIVNLALRISINLLNKHIKTDFLIIDEGFSACDPQNIEQLKAIFNYIKKTFKWCIMISHLDGIKNSFDNLIEIKKKDGASHLKHIK